MALVWVMPALRLAVGEPRGRVLEPRVSAFSSDGVIGVIRPAAAPESRRARSGAALPHAGAARDTARETNVVSDEALVSAARAGERGADEQLYRRHAPAIFALATRLLRSRDDAMDVMQDTFVTAFEELASLRDPAAVRGWLQCIAVRLVHRRFRRRKLLALIGLDRRTGEVSLESLADHAASPEARAELRWIDAALLRVDERARVAWMLRMIDDLALEEVAVACDCSLATAKRRIAAASAVVDAHLSDHRDELCVSAGGAR